MMLEDKCCTLVPYFKIHEGKVEEFKAKCLEFITLTKNEEKCVHYGFSFNGDAVHCREGYDDAEGILAHLENVGTLLGQALEIADLTRLEVHAPASEIEKLKEPLADLKPEYYTMECGFRR